MFAACREDSLKRLMKTLQKNHFRFLPQLKTPLYILMFVGILGLAFGCLWYPERAWANFLLDSYYFLTLSLAGAFFCALQYLTKSRWSEVLRRLPEAIMSYVPVAGIFMLVLFFSVHVLYHWSHHDSLLYDEILQAKSSYLDQGFFFVRQGILILLWSGFAYVLRQNSLKYDETGNVDYYRLNVKMSAIFMIVFALSFSLASFDWIMSLEPHWFSTIFGVYNFSGLFVNGLVVITLMAVLLKERGLMSEINENHFHDLGKLIFAFTLFWAYIWYSQFMLIWYANIPEETVYFVNRLKNDWDWLFYTNFVVNFVLPFFVLLPYSSKRNPAVLKRVCILLLVGRWLDLYLMIVPGVSGVTNSIGFVEISMALGFAAIFVFVVVRTLAQRPLVAPEGGIYGKRENHAVG